jgi:hypothetical protein
MSTSTDTYLTDLSARVLGGFHSARGAGEGWISVSYETENLQGVGLAAGAGSGAPELTFDLGLDGVHTLYLALGAKTALRVWLDGDDGYREFVTEHGGYAVQECALPARDLTGRKLHIAPKAAAEPQPAFIAWIRAETAPQESAEYSSARNLVATNDGWSWIALDGIESERDVWKFFEPMRGSDFGLMLWGPGGADLTTNHPTKIGTLAPTEPTHSFRACDRTQAKYLKPFIENGGDVLKSAVAAARNVGVDIHFYIRPEAFYCPFPGDGTFKTRFMSEHPELRCRDEFGDEIMRLSYAFPEVQNHMLEYFQEILEYSPDGLCFAFNRSLPMMICEEPVLQEFEKQNGRRPALPDEVDGEAMIAARTTLMNGFFRRVRELLDARGMEFSCMVSPNAEMNRTYGLDLMQLAEQKIFDAVMLHNGGMHAHAQSDAFGDFWKKLSTLTRVYPNGWGGSYDHVETAQFLKEKVLDTTFAGGFFWDTENFTANPYNWHPLWRGGTRAYLDGIIAGTIPAPRITPFTRLQGAKLGRYHPGNSY